MWSLHACWSRPAAGREFWVAELRGSGQVVGGGAVKAGAALRPLQPPPAPLAPGTGAAALAATALSPLPADDKAGAAAAGAAAARTEKTTAAPLAAPAPPPEDAAGFNSFEVRLHGPLEPTDALLFRMVVDGRMRRRGVGRALLERLVARADEMGARRVLLATGNPDAASFYEACGFRRRQGLRQADGAGAVLVRETAGPGAFASGP
ncbi:hypothetical protein GPECTOR_250g623 [Gonium pectorale]|uniref:N-acetyltransferase domain-containing protein n=1 Tax=Gonium pectorale TaxID=33097 RepID=A0A150FXH5_GONPE|nr:hypothetical protein GPECTOR_250g623 [Gonium pectorale]|eukprot:KXZ41895.1 hypothetical protein GPECTOR_250g623 [Gonium pectorale]